MKKNELISAIAGKAGITKKDAAVVLEATLESISGALAAGEKVQLPGFGTFEVKHREPRTAFNPRTKEKIDVPASNVPSFKPGKVLKDMV